MSRRGSNRSASQPPNQAPYAMAPERDADHARRGLQRDADVGRDQAQSDDLQDQDRAAGQEHQAGGGARGQGPGHRALERETTTVADLDSP
jgi:hypothetical protein